MKRALRITLGLTWVLTSSVHAEEHLSGAPSEHPAERAADNGRFTLEISNCPTISGESIRRILSIEIGDLLVGADEATHEAHDTLTIRCGSDSAWIEASGREGATSFDQLLRLADFPGDAAPRALALAGLELLAAQSSSVRARMTGKTVPPPPAPVVPAPVAPATPVAQPTRETHVTFAGTWRRFLTDQGASTWGGQVQVRSGFGEAWHWTVDADFTNGHNQAAGLGKTSALLLSSGASVGVQGGGALAASVGVGCRFGALRMSGGSLDDMKVTGLTVWRPWGGPMATLGAVGRVGRLVVTLNAEIGRSLFEVDGLADRAAAITVGGTWLAVMLGGGFRT